MKVCLISSSGGHFTELKQVMSFLPQIIGTKDYDYFFVTMNRVDTKNLKNTFYMTDTSRNPFTILINLFQSLRLFSKTRPDVIVTTGAGFSVPFAYVAKLFGKKIVCIESFCRTSSKSLFARLLYPISNKFYVQWNDSLKLWGNKTEYLNIIELNTKVTLNDFKNAKDVFVTVGSSIYQFDRLIKFVDDLAKESPDKRFFCQIGSSGYKPKHCKWTKYLSYNDFEKKIASSDFVLSHAGSGSFISLVSVKKPFFLIPRLSKFGEIVNDHQFELYQFYLSAIGDKKLVKHLDSLKISL